MKFEINVTPPEWVGEYFRVVCGFVLTVVTIFGFVTHCYHLENEASFERAKAEVYKHQNGVK